MILAAALLVLVGLGLFVGGMLTGTTVLYWLCVVACVAAGVFLLLARARLRRAPSAPTALTRSAPPPRQPPSTAEVPVARPDVVASPEPMPAAEPIPPVPAWEGTAGRDWETTVAPVADSEPPVAERPAAERWPAEPEPVEQPSTAAHAHRGTPGAQDASGDPPVEEVEVTDLLLVVDLRDDVLVVDEHPRYHLDRCRWLAGRETIPIPLDEARTDGFTPCAWCEPDRTLAERERGRRAGRNG